MLSCFQVKTCSLQVRKEIRRRGPQALGRRGRHFDLHAKEAWAPAPISLSFREAYLRCLNRMNPPEEFFRTGDPSEVDNTCDLPIPNTEVKHFRDDKTFFGEDTKLPVLF